MTNKKIIRNELGDEDRNLEPHLFLDKWVEPIRQPDIWMTPELKEAAQALQKAWEISHNEQMTALAIRDVNLKFAGETKRAEFYEALVNLAKLVNPNFPSTYPLTKPSAATASVVLDGFWWNFWYKYFLPDAFDSVMQDTAGTELSTIPTQPEILVQAKAYLKAYAPGFIRMDLEVNEDVDRSAVNSLTNSLREAQSCLMKFLRQLMQSLSDPAVHRVIILGEDQFEVDGAKKEFTGAALRALLVLAKLRDKADFKLEDFARLYHGGSVSDARTDFDNAMKALKRELPNTTSQTPSQNHRSVAGIRFQVRVSDEAIAKRLVNLHKT